MPVAVGILAVIALVAALYLARAFFVPLLIGILAATRCARSWIGLEAGAFRAPSARRWCSPRRGGALLGRVLAGRRCRCGDREAARGGAQDAPAPERRRDPRPTALQNMQEAANEIQGAAADAEARSRDAQATCGRDPRRRARRLAARLHAGAVRAALHGRRADPDRACCSPTSCWRRASTSGASSCSSSGPRCRARRTPCASSRRSTCRSSATCSPRWRERPGRHRTWLAFAALGMEQAGVWGVAAGVLHFIPYLGPVLIAIASGVAGFLQFGSRAGRAGGRGRVAGGAGAVGSLIMTWLQSRLARVNAAVLFIALLFFGWLWGVWGLLLGAPWWPSPRWSAIASSRSSRSANCSGPSRARPRRSTRQAGSPTVQIPCPRFPA